MRLVKVNVMRGPNIWSTISKNLIVMKVDLETYSDKLTNQVEEFVEKIKSYFLTANLDENNNKLLTEFFKKIQDGISFHNLIAELALLLQNLIKDNCNFNFTAKNTLPNMFNIIFEYKFEAAGKQAGKTAINVVSALIKNETYPNFSQDILTLQNIYNINSLGPSTETIINEAISRNIPYKQISSALYRLGHGKNQKLVSATMGHATSSIGVDIVTDKDLTKKMLHDEFVPVPYGKIVYSVEEFIHEVNEVGFPIVVKPRFGNHGRGITVNITSDDKAIFAYHLAKKVSQSVIVEKYIEGLDYRFLLINFKLVAVAKRTPASIVGNGVSTVKELIDTLNNDPNRGETHENYLTKVFMDETTLLILQENGLTEESILPLNKKIVLKDTANMSTGATAVDVTDLVHPYNILMAERIARITNLDICGIDIIAANITQPITADNGAILEVNAAPGFRMHLSPHGGKKRDVAKPFLDMLYPHNTASRIPLVAVTGTNGKTTVVRLVEHIARQAGYSVGMCTTEGIYLNKKEIYSGDCSGPNSGAAVLQDPTIDFAVLECARGGILRSGLAFDHCSVSIVTNISDDHLGLNDVHTLEELARVKEVVAKSTLESGYAILNAEDTLVYEMQFNLHCHIALFAMKKTQHIIDHANKGLACCYIEHDNLYIEENKEKILITAVKSIPLSFNGSSECMIQNILAATLAAWVSRIDLNDIVSGLMSFLPTPDNLPGRMNLFTFPNCEILVDYAHNEQAYVQLNQYLKHKYAKKRIAIIAGTGDRRDEDIWNTGFYSAQLFDEIIIRYDKDARGRTHEEISNLIIQGIHAVDLQKPIKIIPDEFSAITYAINHAKPDTFIWYFPDKVVRAIKFLQQFSASEQGKIL